MTRTHLTIEQSIRLSEWIKTNLPTLRETDKALAIKASAALETPISVHQFGRVRKACGFEALRFAKVAAGSGIKARLSRLEMQVETLIEEIHSLRKGK